jgi:hypothetical protein
MLQSNRVRTTSNPSNDLRRKVGALNDEIVKLEQVLGQAGGGETGTADAAVQRLRASIVQEELVRKRADYEKVSAEARSAGIDVEEACADYAACAFVAAPPIDAASKPRRRMVFGASAALAVGVGLILWGTAVLGGAKAEPAGRNLPELAPLLSPIDLVPHVPSAQVERRGETFFTKELEIVYERGRVYISGDPPPGSEFNVDDGMRIDVKRPDGTVKTWTHNFNTGCIRNEAYAAKDVTDLFQPGVNHASVTLYDICGSSRGTSAPIWLVNRE